MSSIRAAGAEDSEAIGSMLEPVIRAGEIYRVPRDLTREGALAWWLSADHEVFVVPGNTGRCWGRIICARTGAAGVRTLPIAAI